MCGIESWAWNLGLVLVIQETCMTLNRLECPRWTLHCNGGVNGI